MASTIAATTSWAWKAEMPLEEASSNRLGSALQRSIAIAHGPFCPAIFAIGPATSWFCPRL
eukprot:1713189-Amphidinium_carterae.2